MRIFAFGCLSAGLAVYVAQPAASIAAPKTSAAPCSVSGAKYPELIPEYYVWETFFRIHTAGASGQTEGIAPPDGKKFHPAYVKRNAQYMGIAESDLLTFLEVGDKALKRLEQLRQQGARQGGTDTDPDARLDAVEVILDARDDVARRLTPAAMRALRKSSPARGSVFDFPSNQ